MDTKQQQLCNRWFWGVIGLHIIIWTIVPTLARYALPHDTIEAITWGAHLQWGYDKNPWLVALLARLGTIVGGDSTWFIYAISQFFVLLSFFSVWQLGRKMLPAPYALIAALLLECVIYYSIAPPRFNDNIIELGLWPFMALCFYQGVKTQKLLPWLGLGISAGLAMMAKYFSVLPLVCMLAFLIVDRESRKTWLQSNFYIGLLAFLIVNMPHIIWLVNNDFITIDYAINRTSGHMASWQNHFNYPIKFGFAQIINFLPMLVVYPFAWAFNANKKDLLVNRVAIKKFDRNFLYFIGLGPFILILLISLTVGWRLYNEWGMPLLSLWGLMLVGLTRPKVSHKSLLRFGIAIIIVLLLWVTGYLIGLSRSKHRHSDNYPGAAIANAITRQWHERYQKPLKYVAGSRYIAGYVAFYSKDKPMVWAEWDTRFSPWINEYELKKYGAVFIQDGYYGTTVFGKHPQGTDHGRKFPQVIRDKFPRLEVTDLQYFPWHRRYKGQRPVKVLVGFLPPED